MLEAEQFHAAQAQQLASTGLDFLLAQTMPAVTEAEGMARAMIASGLPAVISFCINRDGRVLDGTPLDEAIDLLDDRLEGAPLGYAVNCSHPDFIKAEQMNPHALSRLIGIWANASAREHSELEQREQTVPRTTSTSGLMPWSAPQNPRGEDPRRLLRYYGPTSPLNLRESPPDHPISRPIPHVLMPVSP